jgi:hypothetical protein
MSFPSTLGMILYVWAETTTLLRDNVFSPRGSSKTRPRALHRGRHPLCNIGLFPHFAIKLRRRSTVPKLKHHTVAVRVLRIFSLTN